jgi:hypothetical protein
MQQPRPTRTPRASGDRKGSSPPLFDRQFRSEGRLRLAVKDICAAMTGRIRNGFPGGGKIALIHLAGGWLHADINQFFAG